MAVYDIDGNPLFSVYAKDGNLLDVAYDIDGNQIFPDVIPDLSIMAFNVGCFYSEWHNAPSSTGTVFYTRNRDIIARYSPNFAGFSEWYNTIGTVNASVLMGECFTSYYPDYTPYNIDGAALTSGFSGTPSSVTLVQYATQDSENRYYQKSYISFYGRTVCCILTHLALTDAARTAQFTELLDAVANEEYFIITGDFNFQITEIGDSEYNKSVKVALDRGYNSAQNADSIYMTWYSGETVAESGTIYALDNIITSPNISITDVVVDTTKLTDGLCSEYGIIIDHLPIVATVQLT